MNPGMTIMQVISGLHLVAACFGTCANSDASHMSRSQAAQSPDASLSKLQSNACLNFPMQRRAKEDAADVFDMPKSRMIR